MFSHLRLRLTLLYLLVALLLVALVGGTAYGLLGYYFQTTTDLALQRRMVLELQSLGAAVPPELVAADNSYLASRSKASASRSKRDSSRGESERSDDSHDDEPDEDSDEHDDGGGDTPASRYSYDSELASIFVIPLLADGRPAYGPGMAVPPVAPNPAAATAADAHGADLRTVTAEDGTRIRLLTYRVDRRGAPALLQLGRTLDDQDRILNELLLGLIAMAGASSLVLGAGSWWLAGRSLVPAQQAWERQQTFVANASHELRTPLTLIRASGEVALRQAPTDDADQRALLGDILQECDHMARLVDDLLLLSRLDAGTLPLDPRDVVLADLLSDLQRQFGRVAEERGVALAVSSTGATARADPARLRQVLLILLDNALRHTPAGGTIRLEAHPKGRQVAVVVADSGVGIPLEHLPRVFDRFYRVDSARGAGGGSGLGLAIARALVAAQKGEIGIESEVGKGTRVFLTLPAAGR